MNFKAARCKADFQLNEHALSAVPTLKQVLETNGVMFAVSPIKDVFTSPRKRKMSVEGVVTKVT